LPFLKNIVDYCVKHKSLKTFDTTFFETLCRFSFIVNLNLDSLANRMVWIRGCCRKWRQCYSFTVFVKQNNRRRHFYC